ncbi:MAG: CidA/LrgA family protein [Alphaproteobacteria bacterium]
MILAVAILLVCQLIGETLARGLGLPVPGPVLGMALLLVGCLLLPGLAARVMPTAQGVLAHLSLLFVPAGVGVISHLDVLGGSGPALLLVLVASTALALVVGVLTFVLVARVTGDEGAQAPEKPLQ